MITREVKNSVGQVSCRLEYDEHNKWVIATWQGYLTMEEVKSGAAALLTFIKSHPCDRMLNNSSRSEGMWSDTGEWAANEFMPKIIQLGVKYMATVISKDIFMQMAAEDVEGQIQAIGFSYKNFDNFEEAIQWLSTQP